MLTLSWGNVSMFGVSRLLPVLLQSHLCLPSCLCQSMGGNFMHSRPLKTEVSSAERYIVQFNNYD